MSSKNMIRALVLALGLQTLPAGADTTQAMRTALELAAGRDWNGALAVAPSGVGRDVIEWQRLRAGEGRLGEYEEFLQRRPDWPGLPLLREKGEEAVARSTDPARVIAWFQAGPPETGTGAIAYVRALQAAGRVADAETEAMRAWASLAFSPDQESEMIGLAPEAVGFVHELRLETLLWEGRTKEAERMLSRVAEDRQALARARIALQTESKGVTALIEAVPEKRAADPGLAFDRFIWRMKRDLYDEAAELILERSTSAEGLGRPEAWAERRAILTRYLMRNGRAKEAYRIAANHHIPVNGGASAYADLEFLAGFIALRRLGDAATAETHFRHLLAGVSTPISLARAHYWIGRAQEAAGQDGTTSYKAAAAHQTAFYGLLAAERLGLTLDASLLARPATPDWQSAGFTQSSVLAAAQLLLKAGDLTLGKRFLLHLGESQDETGLAQMADMVLAWDEPHLAVLVAKRAAERGLILPHAYYPIPDFVPDGLKVSRALALSIARRESEFDPAARSSADARGLMQVLPGTAKLMAGKLGKPFDAPRLTSDPAYNVAMGAAYLAEMVDEFGPSIARGRDAHGAGSANSATPAGRMWTWSTGSRRSPLPRRGPM
jgi:soluble lytic murein transglycosylase